jgi:hypothetical protein
MKTTWLQSVYAAPAPYTSVSLDVSRTDSDADHQIDLRWRAVREGLESEGAAPDVLASLEERLTAPTGYGGQLSRILVADADGSVVLDELHPFAGRRDHGHQGPVPHLMPAMRARHDETPYVLVKADHAGADIVVVEGAGLTPEQLVSEGGHDVLHKVPSGGWSQRRYQSRVEDSWERNAEQVARDLDRVVARHAPEVVFVLGEAYSRSAIRYGATGRTAERLVELEHGSRAEGASEEALYDEVSRRLREHRRGAARRRLAELAERVGRDEAVASGFAAVVSALREGSVEAVLLHDDPTSTWRLHAGEQPLQLGRSEQDVRALGAEQIGEERADEVILRAVVALDAELVLVDDERGELRDGISALLRFDIRPPTPG